MSHRNSGERRPTEFFELMETGTRNRHNPDLSRTIDNHENGSDRESLFLEETRRTSHSETHIKITWWRLINTIVPVAFALWKIIETYQGQTTGPTTLDLVLSVLWYPVSYWMSLWEGTHSPSAQWFFDVEILDPEDIFSLFVDVVVLALVISAFYVFLFLLFYAILPASDEGAVTMLKVVLAFAVPFFVPYFILTAIRITWRCSVKTIPILIRTTVPIYRSLPPFVAEEFLSLPFQLLASCYTFLLVGGFSELYISSYVPGCQTMLAAISEENTDPGLIQFTYCFGNDKIYLRYVLLENVTIEHCGRTESLKDSKR
ncbi:hypothetical protein K435DRAFT_840501 [Dendrothele bispora CBS 962.96]|uniref:Uncharacterized protein n=1 Tax=Dendrothele bispora (strain CBS 962.96) TaxID=1314807 RepID=A0A4S8LT52_DENBC|nr:hypothetical protein K435DRAFT_840501 [Dendrothele bispora CBS 962.96]